MKHFQKIKLKRKGEQKKPAYLIDHFLVLRRGLSAAIKRGNCLKELLFQGILALASLSDEGREEGDTSPPFGDELVRGCGESERIGIAGQGTMASKIGAGGGGGGEGLKVSMRAGEREMESRRRIGASHACWEREQRNEQEMLGNRDREWISQPSIKRRDFCMYTPQKENNEISCIQYLPLILLIMCLL